MADANGFRCRHKDCVYRSKSYLHSCDYSTITGELRVKGLPRELWAPELCDKYISGQRQRAATRPPMPTPIDAVTARELYDKGLSDREISSEMKISQLKVGKWRRSCGLKANRTRSSAPGTPRKRSTGRNTDCRQSADWIKALELYQEGKSDGYIGRELGRSAASVRAWRRRSNLPAKLPSGSQKSINWERGEALYNEGLCDSRIAAALGCSPSAVKDWRHRTGREPNLQKEKMRIGQRTAAQIKELHERGLLQTETAVVLGISYTTVRRKMEEMGLPTNNAGGWRRKPILFNGEEIREGFAWDEKTQRFWIFVNGFVRAVAKTQEEAAKLYEEVRK